MAFCAFLTMFLLQQIRRRRKSIFASLKTTATVRVQVPILVSIPIHNKRKLHTIIDAETDKETLLIAFYRALDGVEIGRAVVIDDIRCTITRAG